jgi:CheY-like chemotaxis protein
LGATQLLEDTDLNSFQSGLLDTIKSCSDTLHETLSSVLAYAKVNQFERRQNKYRQRNPPDTEWALPNKQGISGPDTNFKGLYTCVNIAMLCEETAGVLVAGQLYTKSSRRQNEVTVVLNIDFQDSWNYHTEPGAFRRIATNIIGNALKYTKKGLVTITLTGADFNQDNSKQDNDQDRDRIVTLTVKDTGKGMSKDFVDNHLFVPFAQEDSVASHGVGLGMSIVKSLVSLLGGEIDVRSETGKGTEIRVKLPMRLSDAGPDQAGSLTREFERNVTHIRDQHLSVSVLGFPNAVRDSLSSYLQEWFGCTIRDSRDEAGSDIVMVEEGNAAASEEAETRALRQGRRQVLLSIAMKQDRLASPMPLVRGYHNSSRIQRPLGPKDMAKGLLSCIAKLRSSPEEKSTAADTQRAQEKREVEPRQRRRSSASKGKQPERDVKKIQMTQLPERKAGGRRSPPPAVKTQDVQPSPAESTPRSPRATGKASSDLLVLVVEDNAINMRLLKAFLTKYGCRDIEEAGNGVVALEKIETSSDGFDVIFMGMYAPRPGAQSIPVLFLRLLIQASLGSTLRATRITVFLPTVGLQACPDNRPPSKEIFLCQSQTDKQYYRSLDAGNGRLRSHAENPPNRERATLVRSLCQTGGHSRLDWSRQHSE